MRDGTHTGACTNALEKFADCAGWSRGRGSAHLQNTSPGEFTHRRMITQAARPNILFIMADQFRYDCLGASGNRIVRTPNLGRLAHDPDKVFSSPYPDRARRRRQRDRRS